MRGWMIAAALLAGNMATVAQAQPSAPAAAETPLVAEARGFMEAYGR